MKLGLGSSELIVDLFSGGGGASKGIELALGRSLFRGKPLSATAQTRMCGNSVSPPMAAALVKANLGGVAERIAA